MWTKEFWLQTLERTIRTVAQSLIALIGTNTVQITDLDWKQMLLASATAGVLTVLTCIVATGVGDKGTPSLVKESK